MLENSENSLENNHLFNNTVKDNKTSNANTSNKNRKWAPQNKRNENDQHKIVAAIVGDSMVKGVYGQELSDREEKVVLKRFRGSTTENMKTNIQPPFKHNSD